MTMYRNKLAAAIKVAGKVLREDKEGKVVLPFGEEYSVFIKNLNTVRAQVKVEIDSVDVGDGRTFVVSPSGYIDIERFIKAGNLTQGNRFKFIERTQRIEDTRGVGIEDGLVRVEFRFEKLPPKVEITHHYHHDHYWDDWYGWPYRHHRGPYWNTTTTFGGSAGDIVRLRSSAVGMAGSGGTAQAVGSAAASPGIAVHTCNFVQVDQVNDAGITVPGSVSNQGFQDTYGFPVEAEAHVIILKLVGAVGGVRATRPLTVKTSKTCSTCRHVNKAGAKFCSECGTGLELV